MVADRYDGAIHTIRQTGNGKYALDHRWRPVKCVKPIAAFLLDRNLLTCTRTVPLPGVSGAHWLRLSVQTKVGDSAPLTCWPIMALLIVHALF